MLRFASLMIRQGCSLLREGRGGRGGGKIDGLRLGQRVCASYVATCRPIPKLVASRYSHSRMGRRESSMRLLFIYLIVAIELVVATASSAQTVNWGAKSALLDLGMTEQQVMKTVGTAPNKVDMETCGQHTKRGAWRCKIHTYGSGSNKLRVWFQQSPNDRMWRVVSWGP
jgi:hypothetical protein